MSQVIQFEGREHEFPDDFSQAEISSALKSYKPPEDPGAAGGAFLRGIPVAGAYVPKAEAAIRAAMQPITGVGAPGQNFSERYAANLPQREAAAQEFDAEHPKMSGALQMGGGAASLVPMGATGIGARALGLTGSLPARLGASAASGAGLGAADTLARGGTGEEALQSAKWGGGIGAAAVPAGALMSRMITPARNIDPVHQASAALLAKEGVHPPAGDVTGNKMLQYAEQQLGGLAGRGPERSYEQLTGAALRNSGFEGATRVTPDVMDKAFTKVGQEFDNLATRNILVPDRALLPEVRAAVTRFDSLTSATNRPKIVRQYEGEIGNALALNNRTGVPGDVYQSLRSRMEADARQLGGDPAAFALRDMKNALDNAMERSIQKTNPSDLGAWKQVRGQYRNLLVLEKAAADPNVKDGLLTPAALYRATGAVQGKRNLVRGQGDLQPLAGAASDVMRPLPNSGTAQRMLMQGALGGAGGFAFGGGDPQSALLGGIGGVVGPLAAGRALMSRPAQAYFKNQLLSPGAEHALRSGTTGGLLSLMQQ